MVDQGQISKFEIFEFASCSTDDGLTPVSLVTSWLPAWMSDSWVCAEVTPSVSTIEFTSACRSVSVDCCHAGFFENVIDLPATYEVTEYGPSDIRCVSSCAEFGT